MPDVHALEGTDLQLRWLCESFGVGPPTDATYDVFALVCTSLYPGVARYVLFSNKSGKFGSVLLIVLTMKFQGRLICLMG